jgi:RNA polymerase sigma-70 factor (ECF subfamily)
MQEALIKTYQHVSGITDPQAFRTWLYTTVRNACLMKRRRHAGEPAAFVPLDGDADDERAGGVQIPDVAIRADERLVNEWMDGRLRRALNTLPPAYRMIVVMREIEGLSTKEVAAITGYSEVNVKTRLHRARLMLRKQLERKQLEGL